MCKIKSCDLLPSGYLPVDPTPSRQRRPREGRRLPLAQIGNHVAFIPARRHKVLNVLPHVIEAKVAGNVALHARFDSRVDDTELLSDLGGGQDGDDGVLVFECGDEVGFRVGVWEFVYGEVRGEGGGGAGSGDDLHVEGAGLLEGCEDRFAEVAARLYMERISGHGRYLGRYSRVRRRW